MFFLAIGFFMGLPLGFYFREHDLQPPVAVNMESIKKAFQIFAEKEDKENDD